MLGCIFCDDDRAYLGLMHPLIEALIRERGWPVRCLGTAEGAEDAVILRSRFPGPCLVFLDLDFGAGRLRGVDIARRLRQMPDTRIVYVTNHREAVLELLQSGTEPYGFLEKSTDFARLAEGVRRYLARALEEVRVVAEDPAPMVRLHVAGEEIPLPIRDILYLETEKTLSHGITYHTAGGSVLTVIGTLAEEQTRLGEGFFRIHRSYLVNRAQAVSLRQGELLLSDGTRLPCSLSVRREVKLWLANES